MTRAFDPSELTLKDALDLAILIEDEARDRYQEFAHQMELHHTEEAARFFRFMAENEAHHGSELRQRRLRLFGGQPASIDPNSGYEVEAPEYQEARAFMSIREAMEVALAAERKAWSFFDEALRQISDPEIRKLFEELREEEVEHQKMVLEQLEKLPETPEADPEDYVDPPRQQ